MSLERIKCPKCQETTFLTKKGRIMKHGAPCNATGDYLSQWKTSKDSRLAMATLDWKLACDSLYAAFNAARDPANDNSREEAYRSTPEIDAASRECSRTYSIMADLREQLGLCRDPQDQKVRM